VYALTSDDGGATWSSFLIGNTIGAGWARTVVATSATTAFAGSAYGIHRTTDSGATWTQVDATSSMCLVALDASTIISYYRPGFVPRRTTNGGTTWSNVPNPPDLTGMARGCSAGDATTAFMSGYNDQRLVTTDAADTHVLWPTPYRDQNGIDAWSAARFVSVGDGGTIRRSIDGGTVVTAQTSGTVETLQDVEAFGDQVEVAVAVGDGGTIRRSIDGGASWVGVAGGTTSNLAGIDRAQDGALLVVGDAGTVRRSFNDGATWHALTAPAATNLHDVVAMSRDDVWVVGDGGQIYRTTNGGTTWTSQTSGTALPLLAIDSIDGQTAIATSNINGSQQTAIARTSNGGATWTTTMTTGPGSNYSDDVRYLDPTTIIIGGAAEYRKSVDGGATWTEHVSTAAAINAIGAIDGNTFLIAGSNDGISAVVPGAEVADFALGTADFSTLVGGFGACLQTAVATTTTAWPVAGLGNCTAGNLTQWRGVSNDPLAATVASRATPGTAVVTFHFGMRPAATQAVGDYRADLRFEVIAPQA